MGKDLLETYAQEPNVKFILTERPPERWARSVNNTIVGAVRLGQQFPFSILKYFDATIREFLKVNEHMYDVVAGCTKPGDPDNISELCRYYSD
jgi:hypothetical protein